MGGGSLAEAGGVVGGGAGSEADGEICVGIFGQVTNLGTVYNEAQMVGTRLAVLACLIAMHTIVMHLRRNAHPEIRRCVIRVLLLVPVYAADAAAGLHRSASSVPRQLVRQAYEAYVLLCFMRFIFACLGGGVLGAGGGSGRQELQKLRSVRIGIWQYVVVVGAVIPAGAAAAWKAGVYHNGDFSPQNAYPYFVGLQCVSQSLALCSVLRLVHCTRRELAPIRPALKFACIKLLIFFTWLQTVVILLLENVSSLGRVSLWIETQQEQTVSHWWDPFGWYDVHYTKYHRLDAWKETSVRAQVGSGLGNFVLCLEMVFFAALHCLAYPASEWDPAHERYVGDRLLAPSKDGLKDGLLAAA